MSRLLASLACVVTLTAAAAPALAYGPYTHAHVASQAGKRLALDASLVRYYVAGALLADIDKANRLRQMVGSDAIVKMLQGCTGAGPITRDQTHSATSPLVAKLVGHGDARARALGLGMRNHGSTDRYADATAAKRLGHANSGIEDLAFDVGYARTEIAGAKAALASATGLLEDATVRGFIAAAAGIEADVVKTQMRGYACFVKGYVQGKAGVMAPLLKAALFARWTKDCVKQHRLKSITRCTPGKIKAIWTRLTSEHTKIAGEAVDAAIADYRANVR